MSRGGRPFVTDSQNRERLPQFAIDDVTPEHDMISRFVKHQEGEPMLTSTNGTLTAIHVPANVLTACADVLEDDPSMRLADGIQRKLRVFIETWRDG